MARKAEKGFSVDIRKKGWFSRSDGDAMAKDLRPRKGPKHLACQIQCPDRAPSGDDHHIRVPQSCFNPLFEIVESVFCDSEKDGNSP